MDCLSILQYGGITVLIVLLIIFEVRNFQGNSYANNYSYVYYTYNNIAVRIKHIVASRYKVYISEHDSCPVQTKKDRYGTYFVLKARSAQDAEYRIDELYRCC